MTWPVAEPTRRELAVLRGRRATALAHHCRLGCETLHPRFRWSTGIVSIVLSVNSGYE